MAIWLLILPIICGTLAVVTRRWLRLFGGRYETRQSRLAMRHVETCLIYQPFYATRKMILEAFAKYTPCRATRHSYNQIRTRLTRQTSAAIFCDSSEGVPLAGAHRRREPPRVARG